MYYYWKKKGIRPSLFYAMDKGELKLIEAFFALEIEEEVEFDNFALDGFHEEDLELDDFVNDEH